MHIYSIRDTVDLPRHRWREQVDTATVEIIRCHSERPSWKGRRRHK